MLCVSKKLKELKNVIKNFSRGNYSNLEKRVAEAFDHLLLCQNQTLASPSDSSAQEEKRAHQTWQRLALAEESFLRQRSRVQWLDLGDSNTSFYHRAIKSRSAQNQINFFLDESGSVIDSLPGIKQHVVSYFQRLLGNSISPSSSSVQEICDLVPFRCSSSMKEMLSAPFSASEIHQAFFSLPKNKTPGPDGYPAEFFTAQWKTVGPDMIAAVSEFFNSGQLLKQWNLTILSLIPKKRNATKISEYRPIACCNTVYKVISKLLANRLKKSMSGMISNSQSAFIPGRLLVENVLLATEFVQGYNWKSISKRSMLKVDLQKAFDTVNWDFVLNTLLALDFPTDFINLIRQCLTSSTFSVSINGELCGYFKGTRGLRQGDHLSPYLFVLVMEVFSRMLHSKYSSDLIGYHPQASDQQVSHLSFADDIMIFFDGEKQSLENITATLDAFSLWSGLSMNRSKTDLYIAGLTQSETNDISSLGFCLGSMPIRYLGLPLMHRKLRLADYRPLLDKVTSKLTSWSSRALSFAGRKQLISSVIYGTVNFWLSAFILPKACLKKIESLCSRFIWSGNITKQAVAKVSWKNICLPKEEGGLGLRDFKIWNKTLCLKLIWLLFADSNSLWVHWIKANRFSDGSFWNQDEKKHSSWTFKSLLSLRPLATRFIKAQVGNGQRASFWLDNWTPLCPLLSLFGPSGPRELSIPINATLSQACSANGWNLRGARSPAAEALQIHLTSIELPSSSLHEDSYFWCVNDVALTYFSAKHTWEAIRPRSHVQPWNTFVWFKGATPRHAFTMWVVQQDRLPTKDRLIQWGLQVSPLCCLCNLHEENREHLFLRCEVSEQIWRIALRRLGYHFFGFHSWIAFTTWLSCKDNTSPLTLRLVVAHVTIYAIWTERNNRIFNSVSRTTTAIFKGIDRLVRDTILAKRHRKAFRTLMQRWLSFE